MVDRGEEGGGGEGGGGEVKLALCSPSLRIMS